MVRLSLAGTCSAALCPPSGPVLILAVSSSRHAWRRGGEGGGTESAKWLEVIARKRLPTAGPLN